MARRRKKRHRQAGGGLFDKIQETVLIVAVCVVAVMVIATQLSFDLDQVMGLPWGRLLLGVMMVLGLALVIRFGVQLTRIVPLVLKRRRRFALYSQDLNALRKMDPFEFEKFIGHMFERLGYNVKVTQASGDGGLDGLLYKDGKRSAVQVKRYAVKSLVGVREVREFYGSFVDHYANGLFVTTSDYTPAAIEFASSRPIELINGPKLMKLLWQGYDVPWYKWWFGALAAKEHLMKQQPKRPSDPFHDEQQRSEKDYKKFWKELQ